MIELFTVYTKGDYDGHRDVLFSWFVSERQEPPVLYALGIRNYNQADADMVGYAGRALCELFTRAEAEALKAYIDERHGDVTTIKRADLPIENSDAGISVGPAGGGPNCLLLYEDPEYRLPFKVEGFFDLRQHERIDGREYRGALRLIYSDCGRMRLKRPPRNGQAHRRSPKLVSGASTF